MPRWEPLHPELVRAVFVLDAEGMPYAELWRELRPVAARHGERWPSYWRVRRLAIVEREIKRRQRKELDRMIGRLARGMFPVAIHG